MDLRDINIIDREKQVVKLSDLQWDSSGRYWHTEQGHNITPDDMLEYARSLLAELELAQINMETQAKNSGEAMRYIAELLEKPEQAEADRGRLERIKEAADRLVNDYGDPALWKEFAAEWKNLQDALKAHSTGQK